MNWKILFAGFVLFSFGFISCSHSDLKFPQAEISEVPQIDFEVKRYGKALFELDTTDFQNELKRIKPEFSLFLDADLNDTSNVQQLYNFVSDTQLISIFQKSIEVFPDENSIGLELYRAFSRFNSQFPDKQIPEVYTYISDLYFEQPIWIKDSVMVVAIDLYLGSDFPLYVKLGLPYYKVRCMQPVSFPIDVMKAMYFEEISPNYRPQTLLDRMIDGGKLLAYLDAIFPDLPDEVKICYTTEQLDWSNQNEENVWAFLVGNKLLYTKDHQTQTKLIQDAPFTTGFGNQSPSRLGVFIGWKIVLSYLNNHPDSTLEEVLRMTDSQELLQNSGYKPS